MSFELIVLVFSRRANIFDSTIHKFSLFVAQVTRTFGDF